MMLKAIHGSEDREAAQDKAKAVIKKLKAQKLHQASQKVREGIDETLSYYDFPVPTGGGSEPIIHLNGSCVK